MYSLRCETLEKSAKTLKSSFLAVICCPALRTPQPHKIQTGSIFMPRICSKYRIGVIWTTEGLPYRTVCTVFSCVCMYVLYKGTHCTQYYTLMYCTKVHTVRSCGAQRYTLYTVLYTHVLYKGTHCTQYYTLMYCTKVHIVHSTIHSCSAHTGYTYQYILPHVQHRANQLRGPIVLLLSHVL